MRSEEEVRKKLAEVKYRHLSRIIRRDLRRRPHNCVFNREHHYTKDGQDHTVRLCMLGSERPGWNVDICDTPQQAIQCPAFLLVRSRANVEDGFDLSLKDDRILLTRYRDIYMLGWVLGDQVAEYTWWHRLKLWVAGWYYPRLRSLPKGDSNDDVEDL